MKRSKGKEATAEDDKKGRAAAGLLNQNIQRPDGYDAE
jgi:hypothetical protein